MSLIILLLALAVWAALHHQERRHRAEISAECRRLGLGEPPPPKPLPFLESTLTILVGLSIGVPASIIMIRSLSQGDALVWQSIWEIAAMGIAIGVALVVLGLRALIQGHLKKIPS